LVEADIGQGRHWSRRTLAEADIGRGGHWYTLNKLVYKIDPKTHLNLTHFLYTSCGGRHWYTVNKIDRFVNVYEWPLLPHLVYKSWVNSSKIYMKYG
jgi:hypothetical protein